MRSALIWSATCLAALFAPALIAQSRSVAPASVSDAAISGHVTDAKSTPVSHYAVVVFSTDRSTWSSPSRFLKLALSGQDGSFKVTGLPPGDYWVAATDPVDANDVSGESFTAETLERLSFRAIRMTLTERQRVMTVLRLIGR